MKSLFFAIAMLSATASADQLPSQQNSESDLIPYKLQCLTTQANEGLVHDAIPTKRVERSGFSKQLSLESLPLTGKVQIPVVFHVMGNQWDHYGADVSAPAIQEALLKTNEDFQGLNDDFHTVDEDFINVQSTLDIEFKLAKIDPQGNPTTGVVYYPDTSGQGFGNYGGSNNPAIAAIAWDNYKYMNIYIVLELEQPGVFNNSGVAWYPNTYMSNQGTARVVYNGRYLFRNTDKEFASVLTHEFGHWLNLAHTFEGGCDASHPVDGSADDQVADTPSCESGRGCSNIINCKGEEINGENYMDYNAQCQKMFTRGQVNRMKDALLLPSRETLWQESNLKATGIISDEDTAINVNTKTLSEDANLNNGQINETLTISLDGDLTFNKQGALQLNSDFSIINVPAGLTPHLTVTSSQRAVVSFSGTADRHDNNNTVNAIQLTLGASVLSNNLTENERKLTFGIYFYNSYAINTKTLNLVVDNANRLRTFNLENFSYSGRFDDGLWLKSNLEEAATLTGSSNVQLLSNSALIDRSLNWNDGSDTNGEHLIANDSFTDWYGKTGFIGLRTEDQNGYRYAWLEVSVSQDGSQMNLLRSGYHEKPFEPILAGITDVENNIIPDQNASGNDRGGRSGSDGGGGSMYFLYLLVFALLRKSAR